MSTVDVTSTHPILSDEMLARFLQRAPAFGRERRGCQIFFGAVLGRTVGDESGASQVELAITGR